MVFCTVLSCPHTAFPVVGLQAKANSLYVKAYLVLAIRLFLILRISLFVGHRKDVAVCVTYLFVLVSGDSDELCLWKGLAADHLLNPAHLHDVYPRLILVQRVQHDLETMNTVESLI